MGNGDVQITFHRQADEMEFARVLVHESVHGFVYRFKTPATLPVWADEGLAETIATHLAARASRSNNSTIFGNDEVTAHARRGIQSHDNSLGGLLDATAHIDAWQYPLAESLTTFMIRKDKAGYVGFVTAVKEGMPWEDALREKFKSSRASLVRAYAEAMKVKGLKE
jgi:hypothetical protein